HTISNRDWSSDVCSSDLGLAAARTTAGRRARGLDPGAGDRRRTRPAARARTRPAVRARRPRFGAVRLDRRAAALADLVPGRLAAGPDRDERRAGGRGRMVILRLD